MSSAFFHHHHHEAVSSFFRRHRIEINFLPSIFSFFVFRQRTRSSGDEEESASFFPPLVVPFVIITSSLCIENTASRIPLALTASFCALIRRRRLLIINSQFKFLRSQQCFLDCEHSQVSFISRLKLKLQSSKGERTAEVKIVVDAGYGRTRLRLHDIETKIGS